MPCLRTGRRVGAGEIVVLISRLGGASTGSATRLRQAQPPYFLNLSAISGIKTSALRKRWGVASVFGAVVTAHYAPFSRGRRVLLQKRRGVASVCWRRGDGALRFVAAWGTYALRKRWGVVE